MLTTKSKIMIARNLSTFVRFFVSSVDGKITFTRRRGINWALDLGEAIDFIIYLSGGFELLALREFKKVLRKDSVVIDVGANIGAHTLPLAKMVGACGMVFAFEPTIFAFEKLRRNIELNPDLGKQISVNQFFLCHDVSEKVCPEIGASWPLMPSVKVHPLARFVKKSSNGAKRQALDQYIESNTVKRVDLIKLDIDGYELDMLKGAVDTIRRFKPKIMFELIPYILEEHWSSSRELLEFFDGVGYEISRTAFGSAISVKDRAILLNLPRGRSINLWARPR